MGISRLNRDEVTPAMTIVAGQSGQAQRIKSTVSRKVLVPKVSSRKCADLSTEDPASPSKSIPVQNGFACPCQSKTSLQQNSPSEKCAVPKLPTSSRITKTSSPKVPAPAIKKSEVKRTSAQLEKTGKQPLNSRAKPSVRGADPILPAKSSGIQKTSVRKGPSPHESRETQKPSFGTQWDGQSEQGQRIKSTVSSKVLAPKVSSSKRADLSTGDHASPSKSILERKRFFPLQGLQEKSKTHHFPCQSKTSLQQNSPNDKSKVPKLPTSSRIAKTSSPKVPAPAIKKSEVKRTSAQFEKSGKQPSNSRAKPSIRAANPILPVKSSGIQTTSVCKGPAPHKSRVTQKPSAGRQMQWKKTTNQPSQWNTSPDLTAPPNHIKWDGFDYDTETFGHDCSLCQMDLSYALVDKEIEYYEDFDSPHLPEASILACGHVFHTVCLQQLSIPEEHLTEPPCIFCLSCNL